MNKSETKLRLFMAGQDLPGCIEYAHKYGINTTPDCNYVPLALTPEAAVARLDADLLQHGFEAPKTAIVFCLEFPIDTNFVTMNRIDLPEYIYFGHVGRISPDRIVDIMSANITNY